MAFVVHLRRVVLLLCDLSRSFRCIQTTGLVLMMTHCLFSDSARYAMIAIRLPRAPLWSIQFMSLCHLFGCIYVVYSLNNIPTPYLTH